MEINGQSVLVVVLLLWCRIFPARGVDPGEKFPTCLRNLGGLTKLIFPFEKLPADKIERRCIRSALQLGASKNKPGALGDLLRDLGLHGSEPFL